MTTIFNITNAFPIIETNLYLETFHFTFSQSISKNSIIPTKLATRQIKNRQQITKAVIKMENQKFQNKPRILCLHGYRTSGAILQKMLEKWPKIVLEKLQLHFLDGQIPARGKSDVERFFDPPYYEWYYSTQEYRKYTNFEECVAYIEDYMIKNGPFDGLLGFSQGAIITAAVPGMQAHGMAFTRVPKIKFVIIISGIRLLGLKYGQPKIAANAFLSPIDLPSLHIIGERDFLKAGSIDLLKSYVDPVIIHHSKGHIVPELDDINLRKMLSFIGKIYPTPSL